MAFEDIKVHTRLKLFALWSSVICFYIYGDYIELYEPGKLQEMILGRLPFAAIFHGAGRLYNSVENNVQPAIKSHRQWLPNSF